MDLLLAGFVITYLLFLAPIAGWWRQSRLTAHPGPGALRRYYLTGLASWWLAALAALAVIPAGAATPGSFGLAWPSGPDIGFYSGFAVLMVAMEVFVHVRTRLRLRDGVPVPGQREARLFIPGSRAEVRLAFAASASAAVLQELLYRGFLLTALMAVAGLDVYPTIAVSLGSYALSRVHQGWRRVVHAFAIGGGLTATCLFTHSLLLPVVIQLVAFVLTTRLFQLMPPAADAAAGALDGPPREPAEQGRPIC